MRVSCSRLLALVAELLRPLAGMPRDRLVALLAARCGWSAFAVELVVVRLVERSRLRIAGDGPAAVVSLPSALAHSC